MKYIVHAYIEIQLRCQVPSEMGSYGFILLKNGAISYILVGSGYEV